MKKIILTAVLATTGMSASTANAQGLFSWLTGNNNSCPPCTQPVYNNYKPATPNWNTPRPATPYNTNYAPQQPYYGMPSQALPNYQTPYNTYPAYPQAAPNYPRGQVVPVNAPRQNPGLFNTGWSLW